MSNDDDASSGHATRDEDLLKTVDFERSASPVSHEQLWRVFSEQGLLNLRILTLLSALHLGVEPEANELDELWRDARNLQNQINGLITKVPGNG